MRPRLSGFTNCFGSPREQGERIYLPVIVLCEAYWVLESVYDRPRLAVLQAFEKLTEANTFQIDEEQAVRSAIRLSRNGRGGFTDYLIGEVNASKGCRTTSTFDRALGKSPGFQLL